MGIFNPKPHHTHVGQTFSARKNREEEDHSLYFDSKKNEFFIVESTEYESGPNVSCHHSIRELSTEGLEAVLNEHPELVEKAEELRNR